MLSKILSKKTCAKCKFCCSFRKCSLWETPLFRKDAVEKLRKICNFEMLQINDESCGKYNLLDKYHTNNPEEEVPCPFLKDEVGCILSEEYKPFDCKIWPLRIMRKSGSVVIALTPTCPTINRLNIEIVRNLVNTELRTTILQYAEKHPMIIKNYKEGFIVL